MSPSIQKSNFENVMLNVFASYDEYAGSSSSIKRQWLKGSTEDSFLNDKEVARLRLINRKFADTFARPQVVALDKPVQAVLDLMRIQNRNVSRYSMRQRMLCVPSSWHEKHGSAQELSETLSSLQIYQWPKNSKTTVAQRENAMVWLAMVTLRLSEISARQAVDRTRKNQIRDMLYHRRQYYASEMELSVYAIFLSVCGVGAYWGKIDRLPHLRIGALILIIFLTIWKLYSDNREFKKAADSIPLPWHKLDFYMLSYVCQGDLRIDYNPVAYPWSPSRYTWSKLFMDNTRITSL